jgi:Cys-tRNA(Pro)/Cys-tRNA(Cys) deacylase
VKTNAARLLDRLGIHYETREYAVDPDDLTATNVARKIGMPAEQVFKTLLCRLGDGEYVFAAVPGDSELDLKKLAVAAEAKKAEMASLKDVEPLTGYIRGGVTVMGAKKAYRAFVDEAVELFDVISVSAGMRGMQLLLAPVDYIRAAEAVVADLTKSAVNA